MNTPYFENQPQKVFITHKKESYVFQSHFHSFIEIVYCFTGMQSVKIGESIVCLAEGEAAAIFPNIVHEYISDDTASSIPTESISVMCNLNFLSETFPEILTSLPENPYI